MKGAGHCDLFLKTMTHYFSTSVDLGLRRQERKREVEEQRRRAECGPPCLTSSWSDGNGSTDTNTTYPHDLSHSGLKAGLTCFSSYQ